MQGGNEQPPLRLCHAVLAPLNLRSPSLLSDSSQEITQAVFLVFLCSLELLYSSLGPQGATRPHSETGATRPHLGLSHVGFRSAVLLCCLPSTGHATMQQTYLHRLLQLEPCKIAVWWRPEAGRRMQVRRKQQLARHHVSRQLPRPWPPCTITDHVVQWLVDYCIASVSNRLVRSRLGKQLPNVPQQSGFCTTVKPDPTLCQPAGRFEECPPGGLMRHRTAREKEEGHARQRMLLPLPRFRGEAAMVDRHLHVITRRQPRSMLRNLTRRWLGLLGRKECAGLGSFSN